jgi:hypothetical protein
MHDRRERDCSPAQGVGNRELRGVGWERSAAQNRGRAGLDALDQLTAGERREAVLPAVELRDRVRGYPEHGQLVRPSGARGPAENGRHVRAQRLVARDRSRFEWCDEPRRRKVLPHGEVLGHGVSGLLREAVIQGRAVDDREEAEADARHEEGDRHGRPARAPREGDRRQPHVDPPAPGNALQQAKPGHEQARGRDGDDECNEPREEQKERACSPALAQGTGVRISPREGEDDGEERAESRRVERGKGAAAERNPRNAQNEDEDQCAGKREHGGGGETRAPKRRVAEHGARRGPRLVGQKRSGRAPERPSHRRAEKRHCGRLGNRHQMHLPAPASEPGQPLGGRLDVASHADGRENGEGKQERRRLSADEQEPAPGDLPGLARRRELWNRSGEIEEERAGTQRRLRPGRARLEAVDLPGMDAARRKRHGPGVRAVDGLELGERGQLVEALGEQERRFRHPERLAHPRRLGAGQEAEGERGCEVALAHLDETEAGRARDLTRAAELNDLAAPWRALARVAARSQAHPARDVVDGAEVRERTADPKELVLHRANGLAGREIGEAANDERLELLARDAVPLQPEVGIRDRDGPLGRGQSTERAARGHVLRDQASAEHDRQRTGRRGYPEREQQGTAGPVPQTRPREPKRIPHRANRLHSRNAARE